MIPRCSVGSYICTPDRYTIIITIHGKRTNVTLAGAARSTIFVATNTCLSQNFCHDKNYLKKLSRQNFCCDKHTFVATKDPFCRDKHVFVAKKLSWQKWYLWQFPPLIRTLHCVESYCNNHCWSLTVPDIATTTIWSGKAQHVYSANTT